MSISLSARRAVEGVSPTFEDRNVPLLDFGAQVLRKITKSLDRWTFVMQGVWAPIFEIGVDRRQQAG